MLDFSYTGLVIHRAVYAAAKLGIADLLAVGPRTGDELAVATGTDGRSLYRLLRALASAGLFTELPGHRFELTPLGATLRSDSPRSMRSWVLFSGEPFYLHAWEDIVYSIRTGQPTWDRAYGVPFFEYLTHHPESAAIFDEAMTSLSTSEAAAVTAAYDFSRFRALVDVGGGHGTLLAAILRANPRLRGTLFDQPEVVEGGRKRIGEEGLASRVDIVGGSFFDRVPDGGDCYLLKYVIHDWDDKRALAILGNIRRAISKNAKLLLVETIIPPPPQPHYAKIADLEMLVLLGSQERTLEEYAGLLKQAGFRLTRVVPTREYLSIVEAVPA